MNREEADIWSDQQLVWYCLHNRLYLEGMRDWVSTRGTGCEYNSEPFLSSILWLETTQCVGSKVFTHLKSHYYYMSLILGCCTLHIYKNSKIQRYHLYIRLAPKQNFANSGLSLGC